MPKELLSRIIYKFVFAKSIGSHGRENILRFHSAIYCLCPPPPPPQVAYDSYCLSCSLEYVLLPGAIKLKTIVAGQGGVGRGTNKLYYGGFENRGHASSFR